MTTTDPYSLRHQTQRAANDADQAEFFALRQRTTVVDAGIYNERVAGALDDFETSDSTASPSWHLDDLKYDSAVGRIYEEVERRGSIMGSAYPFRIDRGTLAYTPSDNLVYEFLLAICNAKCLTEGEYVFLPRVFERLSARLVAAYLGTGTRFIHTGAPRDKNIGSSFKNAMVTVANETSEWRWGPEEGLPEEPSKGDGGCDFVVWPSPPDGRKIGQLFFLGQCACGNDWDTKFFDLSVKNLAKWFNPLSIVDPVRCFTTPFHVTDATLIEASRDAGFFFDRARLVRICHDAANGSVEPAIENKMKALIKLVVEN